MLCLPRWGGDTLIYIPMKKLSWMFLFLSYAVGLWAQQESTPLKGRIYEETSGAEIRPLVGANVYWLGTSQGVTSDREGEFTLERIPQTDSLVVSFIGYKTDTLDVSLLFYLDFRMSPSVLLQGVDVVHRQKSSQVSMLNPVNTIHIGEDELLKAACCNLSESFETSPSVDVSFTDAVTGTRQIQMLGLAGAYTQITRENMPDVRGLSSIFGLTYIPGTWIESIQLNKGAGSVANGYESIAGQINVELLKPESADRMYLNLFANQMGRLEANANFAYRFKDRRWSTALLLYGKHNAEKTDNNKDGFMDHPLTDQLIALNRWRYIGDDGIRSQFGVKVTSVNNVGGQLAFEADRQPVAEDVWGMQIDMNRFEGFAKIGKVYASMPWKSMGLQLSGVVHSQDSYFGNNAYDASQHSFYSNYIYQSILGNTNHKFKTGASVQYDDYSEDFNLTDYGRKEMVSGVYFEYTYSYFERMNIVAGVRADYHNLYGAFVTPRLHIRYAPQDNLVFRVGAGSGRRTANIFAENIGMLASSRQVVVLGDDTSKPYGLQQEEAWNYGISMANTFELWQREGVLTLDFFRTDFINQIVVDYDHSPQQVLFYNLDGQSYANSLQAQLDYEVFDRFDVRVAYRWYDVKTDYQDDLLKKPLVATNRAFLNLAYSTSSAWSFDYTINWQGKKRIPFTATNPEEYQLQEYSPDFVLMNAQISKSWSRKFDVYLGSENLLGYKQHQAILSSANPFSEYFDSSLIWGPISGRIIYAGLRYRI